MNKKIRSFLIELGLLAFLFAGIILVLNYFNIIPISYFFPNSFMPQKSVKKDISLNSDGFIGRTVIDNQNLSGTRTVISPNNPIEIENDKSEFAYKMIDNSFVDAESILSIDFELKITDIATGSSGIVFTNGLSYESADYRSFRIFYYEPDKSWGLEYRANNKSEYRNISPAGMDDIFGKFIVVVSRDGKSISVLSNNSDAQTYEFDESLYDVSRVLNAVTEVAPESRLEIFSLYYY